jgi:hypothetical protein
MEMIAKKAMEGVAVTTTTTVGKRKTMEKGKIAAVEKRMVAASSISLSSDCL